jgi:hypothetical protein
MPEAAVDEYGYPPVIKHKIRAAREVSSIEAPTS